MTKQSYRAALQAELAALGVTLDTTLTRFMAWLETSGCVVDFGRGEGPMLPIEVIEGRGDIQTHLRFILPGKIAQQWTGRADVSSKLIPFVRVGGDGSLIALWRGDTDLYVFLSSEGDGFVVADTAPDLLRLLTMGYWSLEMREDFAVPPAAHWAMTFDTPWTAPAPRMWPEAAGWTWPETGADLWPADEKCEPFQDWLETTLG